MKVLAIMGSPNGRGSGYKVVRKIEEKMKELGDVEFEYLFLKDADLKLCKGCFTCISRGEDLCPLKDDRAEIEEKISNSDGVILSSPGYVQNVSGLMKNFIDRFAYTNHRLRFFNQKVMLVANGGSGLDKTLEALKVTFGGPEVVYELDVYTPAWPLTLKAENKNRKKIEDASKKFYNSISTAELGSPSLSEYMRFRFFKDMLDPSMEKYLPADYEFYKDKKDYFYDVKIGVFKKAIASLMVKMAFFMMRDIGPGDEK